MMTKAPMGNADETDASLVAKSLNGDAEAFRRIVTRYQSLVCSLAYSAAGSLDQSEDIAQETFVTAWKHLRQLREPAQLRSWLCAIARHRIYDVLQKEGRQPTHAAAALETVHASPALEPLPSDHAISKEEEAILWRAVERIPALYREPLILFYREQQSVAAVAQHLELTEDAVKQRLSRGRKLLTEEVSAFVAAALKRTAPGPAFTIGVLAALCWLPTSSQAAVAGAAATAQSASAAKSAVGWGSWPTAAGPVLGGVAAWLGLKASLAGARSQRERALVVGLVRVGLLYVVNLGLVLFAFALFGSPLAQSHAGVYGTVTLTMAVLYGSGLTGLVWWGRSRLRGLRAAGGGVTPAAFHGHPRRRHFEYQSPWRLFGLPLLHVKFGDYYAGQFEVACGWIAIGDAACGVLFAAGWIAFGGLAAGGFGLGLGAVGLLAFGGLAGGALAAGGMAVGGIAYGCFAAAGGLAISAGCALGGFAAAPQANDPAAREFFSSGLLAAVMAVLKRSSWLAVFSLWPFVLWRGQAKAPDAAGASGVSAAHGEAAAPLEESQREIRSPLEHNWEPRSAEHGRSPTRHWRRLWLRLAVLVPLFCVSIYFFASLPNKMRSASSVVAYVVALLSFLGLLFTLVFTLVRLAVGRRGFAPGWQIRCPACGQTVAASTCMVRVGAIGTERRWGWCDRCHQHRWLVIEPMAPPPAPSAGNADPRKD